MSASDEYPLSTNVSGYNQGEDDAPKREPLFRPAPTSHGYAPPIYPSDMPLTKQPGATVKFPAAGQAGEGEPWMPVPLGIPVCPPGLEYLSMVDQLLVHQKIEIMEVLLGCEMRNKYDIKNSMGQVIYTAKEDSDCCTRNCIGPLRPFEMRIEDHTGREIINLNRECRCQGCCCPCCLQTIEIYSPPGNLVGRVSEEWSICKPKYRIENAEGDVLFRIVGPFCVISCCNDVDFPIFATNGVQIGKITKQWSGLLREVLTDADHFGITFPIDLDVTMKAVLLGALFLIDFNYFEKKQN